MLLAKGKLMDRQCDELVVFMRLIYAETRVSTFSNQPNERNLTMTLGSLQFLFIPIAFACAAYSVAKGKNRNPYIWFCIGFFTGPIASVLLLVMKRGPGSDHGYH